MVGAVLQITQLRRCVIFLSKRLIEKAASLCVCHYDGTCQWRRYNQYYCYGWDMARHDCHSGRSDRRILTATACLVRFTAVKEESSRQVYRKVGGLDPSNRHAPTRLS